MRLETQQLAWDIGGKQILRGVDVTFNTGVMTGIVGPNGCGKTTLLHLLAGLRKPSRGKIAADGKSTSGWSPREYARRMALVEQHSQTDLEVTARHIVELGRLPHSRNWKVSQADQISIWQAMELAEVDHLAERTWQTLSGGERQRVQLARAFAQKPELLLLDEPTNHLDLSHQIRLLQLVKEQKLTCIVVLHDLDLAAAFCDQLVVMSAGKVVASGATEQALTAAVIEQAFGVIASVTKTDRLRVAWSGVVRT
ncbi:MAG: ABC transporter ATP-binding protein [Propionibacteriaceae bacterium]